MPGSGRQPPSPPSTGEDRKAPARPFRLRKYPGRNPQQGDMVIRGVVRARLLGMQLLTLEARVVVGTGNGDRPVVSSLILSPHDPSGRTFDRQGRSGWPLGPGRGSRTPSSCWNRAPKRLNAVGDPAEIESPSYRPMAPAAVSTRAPSSSMLGQAALVASRSSRRDRAVPQL
jgi:hypothetical protein